MNQKIAKTGAIIVTVRY